MAEYFIDLQKVRQLRSGVYSAALTTRLGTSGQVIAGGLVLTEHNPEVYPLEARGHLGLRGRYQKISKHAATQAALQRRKKAIASAKWRLTDSEMPLVFQGDRRLLSMRERQKEYCDFLFWKWQQPGQRSLKSWIREVAMEAPVAGFWLGELVAEQQLFTFSDGTQDMVWVPSLPEYRAPQSVTAWVFQNDEPVGVILEAGTRTEYDGEFYPTAVVLPASKFLLVSRDRVGAQVEGDSEMRAVNKHVELHWALQEIEAMAIERRGMEELFFEQDKSRPEALDQEENAALDDYLRVRLAGRRVAGAKLPPGVKPTLISSGATLPDITAPLERHWRSTLMGMGAEDRGMAADGQGGSRAARMTAAQGSLAEHADDASQFFVEPLRELMSRAIQWSGLNDDNPDYVFTPGVTAAPLHDNTSPLELAQALAMLRNAGLITTWIVEEEKHVRGRLGHREADILENAPQGAGDSSAGDRGEVGDDRGLRPPADRPVQDAD